MVRIISTMAYRFIPPKGLNVKSISVRPLEITDLPDWVEKTNTFKSAVKAETIKVMNDKAETKTVEKVQETLKGTDKQQSDQLAEAIATKPKDKAKTPKSKTK